MCIDNGFQHDNQGIQPFTIRMFEVEYLTDKNGQPKAVVIPIELWQQLFPQDEVNPETLIEQVEDYCLSKAMDEAQDSPLMDRESALAYLEED